MSEGRTNNNSLNICATILGCVFAVLKEQENSPQKQQSAYAPVDTQPHPQPAMNWATVAAANAQSTSAPVAVQPQTHYEGTTKLDATPTEEELRSFDLFSQRLWNLDVNRLVPGKDYELDLQAGKRPFNEGDVAKDPLFKMVSKSVFEKPSFSAFYKLLDNYEYKAGVAEKRTSLENREEDNFIDSVMATPAMQYAHQYLARRGKAPSDYRGFAELLKRTWFTVYRREGAGGDSSAFEHVFVGESKGGKIVGLHNWYARVGEHKLIVLTPLIIRIQLWNEERNGRLDYKGYIYPKRRDGSRPEDNPHLLTFQFEWQGEQKPMSTSFIGVSPEFEVAMYTTAFLLEEDCTDNIVISPDGDVQVELRLHRFTNRNGLQLGSVYPVC
ncbi:Endoribonuclease XendoU-domain-containing protein [Cladochytrium replicatum]|nr:Endoribonuclease XendoU-domain-containing protein [Cladochytrium replicatum]